MSDQTEDYGIADPTIAISDWQETTSNTRRDVVPAVLELGARQYC
jgi:hypothetical protein